MILAALYGEVNSWEYGKINILRGNAFYAGKMRFSAWNIWHCLWRARHFLKFFYGVFLVRIQ